MNTVESVNVVVTTGIGDECLRQITSVSPKVKVRDGSDLARAEARGESTSKEQVDAMLAEAEVLFGRRLPQNIIARAPKLKWIQGMATGVEGYLRDDILRSPVILTSVKGIAAIPVSEFALQFMLMLAKQAQSCFQMKQEKQWKPFRPAVLRSKTVGIIGLGTIGQEVARLAKAFGMRVVATRRTAKRVGKARYADTVLPREQLKELLSQSDFVVLALPLTSETREIIGEEELRVMKPTAYLINVSRGRTVDEKALIRALDEHWIAGAGLDVFATEPLPTDSPLWGFPNVIFSPHMAGAMEDTNMRATERFCENLRRYLNGEKLLNVVNKKKGY